MRIIYRNQISLAISIVLLIVFYTLFMKCYFPLKHSRNDFGNVTWLNQSIITEIEIVDIPLAYDRMILVVIDALRYDFILESKTNMKFIKHLLNTGNAMMFTAQVNPPTVTLPRIKAMTTGGIPGFVDVILNFESGCLKEDNLISQMQRFHKNVIFYGDDTWIKLFPQHFHREEGTTSFFVTDFTEVDNNVTRHLSTELEANDWDMMILHYLGLDHIGHMAGPKSPLVKPKLEEMDGILELIYNKMERWKKGGKSSLLVVCGDHGMSDQGGHGGASPGETTVPIIFIYPTKINHHKEVKQESQILQIDLASTLAVLNNVPIPVNNLGAVIINSLVGHSTAQKVQVMFSNANQITSLLQYSIGNHDNNKGYILFNQTVQRHTRWLASKDNMSEPVWENIARSLIDSYSKSIKLMTEIIKETSTMYDLHGMFISILFLWLILILLLLYSCTSTIKSQALSFSCGVMVVSGFVAIFSHLVVCTSSYGSPLFCSVDNVLSVSVQVIVLFSLIWIVHQMYCIYNHHTFNVFNYDNIIQQCLIVGTVLHSLSYLSSSFVEEEHQTWYFYLTSIHIVIIYQVLKHLGVLYCVQNKLMNQQNVTELYKSSLSLPSVVKNYTEINIPITRKDNKALKKQLMNSADISEHFGDDKNRKYLSYSDCTSILISVVVILMLCRISRCWNQTGNKWLNIPDIGDWLIRPENQGLLTVLSVSSLCILMVLQYTGVIQTFLLLLSFMSTYWYKSVTGYLYNPLYTHHVSTYTGSSEARINYMCILALCVEAGLVMNKHHITEIHQFSPCLTKIQTIWISLMVLLLRAHNLPLILMMVIIERLVSVYIIPNIQWKISLLTIYCYWMGQTAFFYQGNSNSLTTIDLAAGYTGLHNYQPVITAILITCSTFSGQVFWFLAVVKYILKQRGYKQNLYVAALTILLIKSLPIVIYTILVTFQRYHLFVWTVFSPKVLYEGALLLLICVFSVILLLISFALPDNSSTSKQN